MTIFKTIIRVAAIVGAILLIPLFANFLIEGWNWTGSDFVFAFVVLFVTGIAIDVAARKIMRPLYKAATIAAIALVLAIFWIEMATGGVSESVQAFLYR
jgi:hypothetical protein